MKTLVLLVWLLAGVSSCDRETEEQLDWDFPQEKFVRFEFGDMASMERIEDEGKCTISISFGSYATGTDASLMNRVFRFLSSSEAVTAVYQVGHGREGENTSCIFVENEEQALGIYEQLRDLIQEVGVREGYVHLSMEGKETLSWW